MILNGGFTYEDSNQRELLFGVKIQEVKGSSDVFVGRTSEARQESLLQFLPTNPLLFSRQLLDVLAGDSPHPVRDPVPSQRIPTHRDLRRHVMVSLPDLRFGQRG